MPETNSTRFLLRSYVGLLGMGLAPLLSPCFKHVAKSTQRWMIGPFSVQSSRIMVMDLRRERNGESSPLDGSRKDFFARYAFADQVAAENLDSSSNTKLSTWAPQLTAMHHPLLSYTQVHHIGIRIDTSSAKEAIALSFSRAACAMSHRLNLSSGTRAPGTSRLKFYNDLCGYQEGLENSDPKRKLFECDIFPWITNENYSRSHDASTSTIQVLSLAYAALPMIYYELLRAMSESRVGRGRRYPLGAIIPSPPPNLPPPTSSQIPFSTFMALPLPFSAECVTNFNTCHMQSMCTTSFIEAGTWTGHHLFVSHNTEEPANFICLVDGVQFSIFSEQPDTERRRIRSNGGFIDPMGQFSFELNFKEGEGLLQLTIVYSQSEPMDLQFQGVMTPFGIVATFGITQPIAGRQTHWLWLWKSE